MLSQPGTCKDPKGVTFPPAFPGRRTPGIPPGFRGCPEPKVQRTAGLRRKGPSPATRYKRQFAKAAPAVHCPPNPWRIEKVSRFRRAGGLPQRGAEAPAQDTGPARNPIAQSRTHGSIVDALDPPQRGGHSPAQGNALGDRVRAIHPALKGSNSSVTGPALTMGSSSCVLSGDGGFWGPTARALPGTDEQMCLRRALDPSRQGGEFTGPRLCLRGCKAC
jgi:hypothetical protein